MTRDELASRLAYWPLLRLLLLDWRFRVAAVVLVMVFAAAALGLPRIWRVTPSGFNPVVRISLLDRLQAWNHGRIAAELDAKGDWESATHQWRLAVANHPGSETLLRGSISNLLAQPPRQVARFNRAIQQTFWLLQLNGTNQLDRDLAIQVCEHYGVDDLVVALVRQTESTIGPVGKAAMLKALVRQGQPAEYRKQRQAWLETLPEDPELALHHAAWQAAWGANEEAAAGLAAVKAAEEEADQRLMALRLQLLIHGVRQQVDDYAATLARLKDLHADEPLHHVGHWTLLRAAGRTNEAIAAAREHSDPPLTANEVTRQAQALVALGLTDDATQFLEHFSQQLGSAGNVWASYARLLIDQQRWRELRALAGQIRQNEGARISLGGYSWFLEGLAQHHLGNDLEAAAAFASVPQFPLRDSSLVLDTARQMAALGAWAPARDLLLGQEVALGRLPEYWRQVLRAAWELRDSGLVLRAAERQYAAQPGNPAAQNDLAAALLIEKVDNDRALELTARLVRSSPTSLQARINHACALIRNGQTMAAKPLLLSVDEGRLDPVGLTALNLVRAELSAAQGDAEPTLAALAQVDTNILMAPQLIWWEELRTRATNGFPPATANATNPR